ncbi:MAG TPA: 50S ribosomal protein L23 [Candidatus Paceibacterota bacterium]|nr:50S ribosomal protein L23 [Candidatus Paceibacterota bacterium]
MHDAFLIKKPWVTERATDLSKLGKYVFIVKRGATKPEVKKAVKEIYKVDVIAVNIVNRPDKRKRSGPVMGRQPGYKKAIVTLKEGQKIDIQ